MPTLETLLVADPQYEDIWKDAIKQYEKDIKAALPSKTANANSLDDVARLVEEQQKQFAKFRKKGQVAAVVKVVLTLVESFSEVAGESVKLVSLGIVCRDEFVDMLTVRYIHRQRLFLQALACCFRCVTFSTPSENDRLFNDVCVGQAVKGVSSNYDSIIEMFERFQEFLDRLQVHLQSTITPPLRAIIVGFLSQLLLTIGLKTKLMKEGRVRE